MNDKYIFFWNNSSVFFVDISNYKKRTQDINKLSIIISKNENTTFIKNVRTGSDKCVVGIRV